MVETLKRSPREIHVNALYAQCGTSPGVGHPPSTPGHLVEEFAIVHGGGGERREWGVATAGMTEA